jgi:FKBP-type peptidyl-prolyl cis-trans isomerase (trigger factor)
MRPEPGRFLGVAAGHLMAKTAGALAPGYEQSSVSVIGLMLTQLAEEFERAAARRIEENRALRRIFADAVDVVADDDLRAKLAEAARGEDANFAVSALEQGNCALRSLLIELHVHVEELDSEAARSLEAEIWHELVASTERRKLGIGPF